MQRILFSDARTRQELITARMFGVLSRTMTCTVVHLKLVLHETLKRLHFAGKSWLQAPGDYVKH